MCSILHVFHVHVFYLTCVVPGGRSGPRRAGGGEEGTSRGLSGHVAVTWLGSGGGFGERGGFRSFQGAGGRGQRGCAIQLCGTRDAACPVSTGGGTRRVQSVREGGGRGRGAAGYPGARACLCREYPAGLDSKRLRITLTDGRYPPLGIGTSGAGHWGLTEFEYLMFDQYVKIDLGNTETGAWRLRANWES